jgi:ABC-type amino acid transport substrate-binding protein
LSKFEKINTLDELKAIPVGLHKGWVTTKLFNLNAFNVIETGHFEGLFLMLNRYRFDYIPRGVYEVYDELASRQDVLKDIVVEPTIALFIPTMSYVNVSPTDPKIAKRLASGLLQLQNNGELKKILHKYYGNDIKRANLKNRKVFEINHPNFSPHDKLNYEILLENFNN